MSNTIGTNGATTLESDISMMFETSRITGQRLTVVGMAEKFSMSPEKMRKLLRQQYGDRIEFRRGRTGGIVIS
jgi:hypothetical protein